jgi:hypothetical protein
MKYMLMMHVGHDDGDGVLNWAPQDIKAMIEFQHAFDRELEENGEMVFNAGLSWPDQARIVRYDGGVPAVTDGPFPETKEFLIGFWIVDCDSEERAYAIAAKASSSPGPGGVPMRIPIEVRPVAGPPQVDALPAEAAWRQYGHSRCRGADARPVIPRRARVCLLVIGKRGPRATGTERR